MEFELADGTETDVSVGECMDGNLDKMSSKELKGCIGGLLGVTDKKPSVMEEKWSEPLDAEDPENLTIGIIRSKADKFKFLGSETKWRSMGKWLNPWTGEIEKDKNYQIEVLFKDNRKEEIGERLMKLLKEYNKKEVDEELLFAKTNPVEETTLFG